MLVLEVLDQVDQVGSIEGMRLELVFERGVRLISAWVLEEGILNKIHVIKIQR